MDTRNNKATEEKQQFVKFADDLSEVIALNYFLYDVFEAIHKDSDNNRHNPTSHLGLVLFLRYLRERDQALRKRLDKLRGMSS